MDTANVTVRMDAKLKKQAEIMLSEMGLNMSSAVNIFIRQVVRQGKIPFEIASNIPNEETLEAMREMEDIVSGKVNAKEYTNLDELFEDLDS